jgi:formylglycine-generating enzyme required for sulfatase activity
MTILLRLKKYTIIPLVCLLIFFVGCDKPHDAVELVKISPIDGKEMVLIPAGEFIMGTNKTDAENTQQKVGTVKPLYLDQHPERKVSLDAYYIDRYEVTNKEYKQFVEDTKYPDPPSNWVDGTYPEGKGDHPVTNIIWQEALAYALWAGKRLPTEEQWEKAARGPNGLSYPWGDEYIKGNANVGVEGAKTTLAVGSHPKDVSPYQVFDMAGNVMEWTLDWYLAYPGNTHNDPRFGRKFKVLRGNAFQKSGHYFLDAYRFAFNRTEVPADEFFENVGFRCILEVPTKK